MLYSLCVTQTLDFFVALVHLWFKKQPSGKSCCFLKMKSSQDLLFTKTIQGDPLLVKATRKALAEA